MAKSIPDLTGQRFGRWTVIAAGNPIPSDGAPIPTWRCRCACGTERDVKHRVLCSGNSGSCGCRRREALAAASYRHGRGRKGADPTYITWGHMIARCGGGDPHHRRFYTDRGITVCDRWRSFENFLADMGDRPGPEYSIDRIDGTKAYEPGNCRWATDLEQGNNQSSNRWIELNGERKTIAQWGRAVGINPLTINSRLRCGWSEEDAVTKPLAGPEERRAISEYALSCRKRSWKTCIQCGAAVYGRPSQKFCPGHLCARRYRRAKARAEGRPVQ